MRFMVLIFLTCATGGFSSGLNELQSLMGDVLKVLIYGGPVDDIAQKFLYEAETLFGTDINNFLDAPLDSNTTDKLDLATESIASGIDTIMEEVNLFRNFPAIQEMYDVQIRIAMRLLLSEAVKKLVQLSRMPMRKIILST